METTTPPSAAMKQTARAVYLENRSMNAHKRLHDAARKRLLANMHDGGVTDFRFATKDEDGLKLVLDVLLDTPDKKVMDAVKLRALVDDATFMQIVGATKAAIEEFAGKAIAAQCEVTVPGAENVAVKVGK